MIFVTVSKQFILPRYNIFGADITDLFLPEIRKNFCFNNILLGVPCTFFYTRLFVMLIQLPKRFKCHIHICRCLLTEFSLPLLCLTFCIKASFAFLLTGAMPINVTHHHIPGTLFLVFIYRHLYQLLSVQAVCNRFVPKNIAC